MFCQLMFQAEDLGAEGTRVISALVVGCGEVLLEPVPVVEHFATLVTHDFFLFSGRTLQSDAHVLNGHVNFQFGEVLALFTTVCKNKVKRDAPVPSARSRVPNCNFIRPSTENVTLCE